MKNQTLEEQAIAIINDSVDIADAMYNLSQNGIELNDVHSDDELKEFAKSKIDDDMTLVASHVLDALTEYPETDYFDYDYSMGICEEITPIESRVDLIDLVKSMSL